MKKIVIIGIYVVVLSIMFLPGCGQGSTVTMPTVTNSDGSSNSSVQSNTQATSTGWTYFKNGLYSDSKTEFLNIINTPGVSDKDKALAYTGLGWAQIKSNGFYENGIFNSDIISYFDNADALYNDAKVGLAVAYLTRNSTSSDSDSAVTLLKGAFNSNNNFISENSIDLTNADVHLLYSMALFETGDTSEAQIELNTANSLGSSSDSAIFNNMSDTLMSLIY